MEQDKRRVCGHQGPLSARRIIAVLTRWLLDLRKHCENVEPIGEDAIYGIQQKEGCRRYEEWSYSMHGCL